MIRHAFATLCVLVFFATTSSADEWTTLFDGTSTDAWRGYNKAAMPDKWSIEEGVLVGSGGGDIITKEKYTDFELELDWKIAPGGNSGIMYRVLETKGPSYQTGPEYQLLDNESHKLEATADTATGSLYALYPPTVDAAKPVGEWNTTRIVSNDGHVEHWLNGKKVVDAELGSDDWNKRVAASKFANWKGFGEAKEGHIALQDHGSKVYFKNIRIRPLKADSSAQADRPLRVLMVTRSGGFQHSSIARKTGELSHAEKIMTELGIESGLFRVTCTKDVETEFTPEVIENFDIVMFYTTGKMYDESKKLPISEATMNWFLGTWLKQPGHGFIGVHSAADTFEDYEPYWDVIGGTFDGHPWSAGSTVAIKVHDQDHPASKPWGSEFAIQDEIYQFKHWQPEKVRVLMSLDMEKTELKKPYHVPILWVKEYGDGRAMHMSLGHREEVWSNPKYQESLLGGIRWLAGLADGDATPNPEVDAAENNKAKAATVKEPASRKAA